MDYMDKLSALFKRAKEQDGVEAVGKASDAIEKIDLLYLQRGLGNIGLEKPVTDDELIQAVADLDEISKKYIGEPLCGSSDINVVKKFILEYFNNAYKKR